MSSVCTDGRRSWIQILSRGHGRKKKTRRWFSSSKSTDRKTGASSQAICPGELGSSAERDGITIWTLRSKEANGLQKRTRLSLEPIENTGTNGPRLQSTCLGELTITLKTISTPLSNESSKWKRNRHLTSIHKMEFFQFLERKFLLGISILANCKVSLT